MKCHKPNTDQKAEFIVFANGIPCPEYMLAECSDNSPNIVECFIPVTTGDHLTVEGTWSGSVLRGSFDLLADGSFLFGIRLDSREGNQIRYYKKRGIKFTSVLDCPIPPNWTSIENPKEIVEGDLHVNQLDQESIDELPECETVFSAENTPGLGSLTVVIFASQDASAIHDFKHFDITSGRWIERESVSVRKSGIMPTHELEMRVTHGKVSAKRSTKHRNHYNKPKFGSEPWAKFIFYYRSRSAIENAGCVARPNEVQQLEPADPAGFTFSTDEVGRRKPKPPSDDGDEESDGSNDNSRLFGSANPADKSENEASSSGKFVGKKGRLGGFLRLDKGSSTNAGL